MKIFVKLIITILFFSLAGCASFNRNLKAFLNGGSSPQKIASSQPQDRLVTYSENPNVTAPENREYHRMTKKQFEDEQLFSDNAGSLWTMEGQDSYLFAQNIVRLPGDILNVQLDGQPEKQLSTKAQVIKELTDRIEKARHRNLASQEQTNNKQATPTAEQDKNKQAATAPAATPKPEEKTAEENYNFDVKTVPARVVERMSDGSYRVKGAQTFMIGPKEYRVIVTGLVKASDISNDSIVASKMMDSRFDIVRPLKGRAL